MNAKNKRPPRAERIAEILRCAKEVFCKNGYNNTLISEIAEKAGVVEGAIYYYFPGKRDLMHKVIEEWISGLVSDYDKKLRGVTGTRNRLKVLLETNFQTVSDEPAMTKLYYQQSHIADLELYDAKVSEQGSRYGVRLHEIIGEAISSGEFRDDIPLEAALSLIAGAIQVNSLALLRGSTMRSPEQLADFVTDIFYRGLVTGARSKADPLYDSIHKIEDGLQGLMELAKARSRLVKGHKAKGDAKKPES